MKRRRPFDDGEKRRVAAATAASILIHLLLILGIAWIVTRQMQSLPQPPEPEPLEITLMPDQISKPATPQFVQTDPTVAPAEAPKNARFESDNNSVAAGDAAPSGSENMPSVDGRESPAMELVNSNYVAGRKPQPATPPSPQSTPEPQAAKPKPTPPPPPTQLALREAPTPPPNEEHKPESEQKKATPQKPSAPGFQPETRVTRLRGSVSNRGRPSLEAAATPLGRYKKMVSDAIGSRWYYYVNNQLGLLNIGTVSIRFVVQPDGKVRDVRVLSNTSNESFASLSVSAIIEAEIPPIPPEVAKILDNSRIEIDYSFTILSN